VLKKKGKNSNVIIRYSMMSGIKLTVLLPTLNTLIRSVVTTIHDEKASTTYLLILCHSTVRCSELEGFCKELTTFCKDVVDVVGLYFGDVQENIINWKKSMNVEVKGDMKALYHARCKVVITTPN
jgi:hypothetical protein